MQKPREILCKRYHNLLVRCTSITFQSRRANSLHIDFRHRNCLYNRLDVIVYQVYDSFRRLFLSGSVIS
jgi:hypothetical protein